MKFVSSAVVRRTMRRIVLAEIEVNGRRSTNSMPMTSKRMQNWFTKQHPSLLLFVLFCSSVWPFEPFLILHVLGSAFKRTGLSLIALLMLLTERNLLQISGFPLQLMMVLRFSFALVALLAQPQLDAGDKERVCWWALSLAGTNYFRENETEVNKLLFCRKKSTHRRDRREWFSGMKGEMCWTCIITWWGWGLGAGGIL